MYNPQLARYMQPDPIGVNGGMNIYSYVENNPLNMNDPAGLNPFVMDDNGNIVEFSIEKKERWQLRGGISPVYSDYVPVILKLKNGIEILAGRHVGLNTTDKTFTADCHGWTFANGKYWIDNSQVNKIINSGLYNEIISGDITEGDIVIYYGIDPSLGKEGVQHSTTIFKNTDGLGEYGKNSFEKRPYFTDLGLSWKNRTGVKVYREIK